MSLAMACDFAIAEENTKMSFAFSSIGLAPDMGSSVLLTRRVGPARAADLFMTGRRFTGKEAADMGIITRAVPAEELEENVKNRSLPWQTDLLFPMRRSKAASTGSCTRISTSA